MISSQFHIKYYNLLMIQIAHFRVYFIIINNTCQAVYGNGRNHHPYFLQFYFPNIFLACFILFIISTPNGHRGSHAPQAMQSPALCSNTS